MLALLLCGLAAAGVLAAIWSLLVGWWSGRSTLMRLVISQRIDHDHHLFTLILRRPFWLRLLPLPGFEAGHSSSLGMAGTAVRRRYSLARWQPHPRHYEFTIKREKDGQFSPWLFKHARQGCSLLVSRPKGHFHLPPVPDKPKLVLLAGGVGITPMLAMAEQALMQAQAYQQIDLFWQVRTEAEAIYRHELDSLAMRFANFQVHYGVSRPTAGKPLRMDANHLQTTLGSLQQCSFFMCASNQLMDTWSEQLQAHAVPADDIHLERFSLGGDSLLPAGCEVSVNDQLITVAGHRTLLDALLAANIPVRTDCRTGSCGLCKVRLTGGSCRYPICVEASLGENEILACCAIPDNRISIAL